MFIYMIVNTVNDKKYIGKTTKQNLSAYFRSKLLSAARKESDQPVLFNAINKYGPDSFIIHCLRDDLATDKELCTEETRLIALFKCQDRHYGYNITAGGEGVCGLVHSSASKRKMRIAKLGKVCTDTTRKAMSDAQKQRFKDNPEVGAQFRQQLVGREVSIETREQLSKAHKGKVVSPESKAKIKVARALQVITPEHKAAISAGAKSMWQRPEVREKHRLAMAALVARRKERAA